MIAKTVLTAFPQGTIPQGIEAGDLELNNDVVNLMRRLNTGFEFGWFMGRAVGPLLGIRAGYFE